MGSFKRNTNRSYSWFRVLIITFDCIKLFIIDTYFCVCVFMHVRVQTQG